MNEEELHALVARARAAEGTPSRPPPDLVDQARAAARRRRRFVTVAAGGAVAAVVVAGMAVPRLVSGDQDPGPDQPVAGTDTGELEAHGGPCPTVLPTPVDDSGHGFGTSTRASDHPSFTTPDSAWVCQYGTRPLGTTDAGTQWEWALNHTPRRLDDVRLGPVGASLQSIANTGYPQACTDDLGPRWLLVTSTDGDLTGVVADGYGCGHLRLRRSERRRPARPDPEGTTYAFPPGKLTLGCASPPGMDETGTVTVDVTDPYGLGSARVRDPPHEQWGPVLDVVDHEQERPVQHQLVVDDRR